MSLVLILLSVGGLLLHFLLRWGEAWRTKGQIGPFAYAMQELPTWLAAIIGTAVCMLMLQSLPQLLGIPPGIALDAILQVAAFTAGYMGSSVAAKLPAIFTGTSVR